MHLAVPTYYCCCLCGLPARRKAGACRPPTCAAWHGQASSTLAPATSRCSSVATRPDLEAEVELIKGRINSTFHCLEDIGLKAGPGSAMWYRHGQHDDFDLSQALYFEAAGRYMRADHLKVRRRRPGCQRVHVQHRPSPSRPLACQGTHPT